MLPRCAASTLLPRSLAVLVLLATGCPKRGSGGPPQHYDDPKAMIAVFEAAQRDEWQQPDRVVKALPIERRDMVLADIGAGSGYFTRRLAQRVPEGRVYAVDVDGEFADYLLAQREQWGTPNIEPRLAMYDDPMLPPGELDLVFTANTYAYIRDRVDYFRKVRDALKPGGHLIVLDFKPDATVAATMAPDPRYRVTRDTAVHELELAGFRVVDEPNFLALQWFLVLTPTPK
ncbi:MAG: methyltransferase domain-containing protein [Nannocystaceae bacterium]|nr:methyltransferase domain-containing protein [Deltaproteobacteria bacterium]MBP7290590.1 methyltransferase domain-containing protein [Nannocystaceae bacterium]